MEIQAEGERSRERGQQRLRKQHASKRANAMATWQYIG